MMMLKTALRNSIGTDRKTAAVNIILVANAFIWYFQSYIFLQNAIDKSGFSNEAVIIFGIGFAAIAVSALFTAHIASRLRSKLRFLSYWMLAGVAVSLMPIVLDLSTYAGLVVFSTLMGVYFGSGMPICLGYYAAHTETGNRARLSGITYLLIGIGFILFSSMGITETTLSSVVLSAWRGIGLVVLLALRPKEARINLNEKVSFKFVLTNRSFLLYFVPWCLFMFVNLLMTPVITKLFGDLLSQDILTLSSVVDNAIAFMVALLSGFLADIAGRKRLTVAGFALLGMGYAVLGLFPGNLTGYWFYTILDGLTWGIFYTVFLITIWGDLAQEKASEKYYALGSLPFLLSVFLRLSIGTYIVNLVPNYGFFSYASVFLFLAVLPLIYAPETLPEKTMKDRELKNYIEKAKKEVAKAHDKEGDSKQCENKDEEELVELKVNQEDDEKARQLAEKYY